MRFQRENGGFLSFNKSAVETLLKYRQFKFSDKEAGGMLLGRLINDCEDIIVDEVTTPFPSDKSSRFSFFRGKKEAQKLIEEKWYKSKSTQIYLGEWHTHPEDDPTPSESIDIKNWHKITDRAVFEQESLFFLIVGRKKTRIWELNKKTKKMAELLSI
jgi:integrative and conjugative element protein (TIGR02256 family)